MDRNTEREPNLFSAEKEVELKTYFTFHSYAIFRLFPGTHCNINKIKLQKRSSKINDDLNFNLKMFVPHPNATYCKLLIEVSATGRVNQISISLTIIFN